MSENRFACAYLDLLGFQDFLDRDLQGALGLLTDFHTIIQTEVIASKLHPIESSTNGILKILAERRALNSFECFLPFSDSIFIKSSKPDLFVGQLSSFLLRTFLFKAHVFRCPESQHDPTKVTIKEIGVDIDGKVTAEDKEAFWFPAIFRGGIDYGDCYSIEVNSIKNGKLTVVTNLVGKSVVKAVNLEKEIKGPRLFCTQAFYEALRDKLERYIVRVDESRENLYEIYWTAFNFIETNDCEGELINSFEEVFMPAVNLWKAYNHLESSLHYYNFLKLIVRGTLHFFSFKEDELNQAKKHIILSLKREGLENKAEDLIGSHFT